MVRKKDALEKESALANATTQDRARRIKKGYRKLQRAQTGCGTVGDLAKLAISMGSKAISSVFGKKINR